MVSKAVADDGSNKATNLTDAINNVAKNAAAAIENAVGDVRAEIHGDTGDHKEIKLGEKLLSLTQMLDDGSTLHVLRHAHTNEDLCYIYCTWTTI